MISEDVAVALDAQFDWLTLPSNVVAPAIGNLFIQDLPSSPDFAVATFQYGGQAPEAVLGNQNYIEKPRLQVLVRSMDISEAFDRAYDIWHYLLGLSGLVNGVQYSSFGPVSSPEELGPDSANRQRVVANFQVWKG